MFCSRCGKQIEDNAIVCPFCGVATPNYHTQVVSNLQIQTENTNAIAYSSKSKTVAYLLAFFFGYLGLHNFYLGKTGKGLFQLALTGVSLTFSFALIFALPFLSTFGGIVSWVWAIIEGIKICTGKGTDKNGKILK